jgi:hypothetical protein
MKKIAFLFLTLTDVNFPKIWDEYFKGHEGKYTIYIHPKFPEQVTWHKDRIISNLKETAWGFITKANTELLKEAIKDKDNYKFISLSETCLPIQSFDRLYEILTKDDDSWIKLMKITKYKFNQVLKKTPGKFIHHYARFCLNRHHVKKILINRDKLSFFHNMHVGDEYFLSVLYPLRNFKDREITFDDWEYTQNLYQSINNKIKQLYEDQERKNTTENSEEIKKLKDEFNYITGHPKTIINVEEDLDKIKNCNSFFYRKFSKKSNIEKYWQEIIDYYEDKKLY